MENNIQNNINTNEDINNKSEKKKIGLSIDYSKFQQNFTNNKNEDNIKDDLNNKIEENIIFNNNQNIKDGAQNQKNFDQFLLNENASKSSFSIIDNQKEINNNKVELDEKNNNISNKINENDFFDDISLDIDKDENLLTINYKDLIKNNINNNKVNKENEENKKKDKNNDLKNIKLIVKTPKKKKKYDKFVNNRNNNGQIETNKNKTNYSNDKNNLTYKLNKKEKVNSYVQMIKNNREENKIRNKSNNKDNDNFNLFNGVNINHNKSNISEMSINALSAINNCDVSNNGMTSMIGNDDLYEISTIRNKTKVKVNKKGNILYSDFNKRYNFKPNLNKNASYDDKIKKKINKYNLNKSNNKNNKKKIYPNYDNKTYNNFVNYKFHVKSNNNNNINKKEDDKNYIDKHKSKYLNKGNKYIKSQNNIKTEINILKKKLKQLSDNETQNELEIEKLKRKNNNMNNIDKILSENIINNDILNDKKTINILDVDINDKNDNIFEQKLDNIIQKYNKSPINSLDISSFSNKINITKNDQLLEIFGLDQSLYDGENISDSKDSNNYIEVFNKYPMLKNFINLLAKKYKNEKEYRKRLEEKTIEIFTNDMKRINFLEEKVKKYEEKQHSKINSSLNYSYDNDLSDDITTKNFCRSVEKSL